MNNFLRNFCSTFSTKNYKIFRTFHLILNQIDPHSNVFSVKHYMDIDGDFISNSYLNYDKFLYEGYVEGKNLFYYFLENFLGDVGSTVYGSILDGIFDGHVRLGNGKSFTIEKSTKYYSDPAFHSLIYEDKFLKNIRQKRDLNFGNNENSVFNDDDDNDGSKSY